MYFFFQMCVTAVFFALAWYGASVFYRGQKTKQLKELCSQKKAIVLTYDDGPSENLSARLIALLSERKQFGVFFLLGEAVQEHSEIANRIAAEGHDIGSHTYFHTNAWKTNPWRHFKDIKSGHAALTRNGMQTSLFRPPFGKATLGVLFQAFCSRIELVFWTIDSQDSWDRRPIPDILDDIRKQNGGVILMHDRERPLRGPTPEKHPDYLMALTSAILDMADEEGYNIMRFTDLKHADKGG